MLEQHGPAVLRFCVAQVGRQRADDCFQDTMLAAMRAYGQLRDRHAVKTWLFSIAARKAIDAHRAQARAADPTDEIDDRSAAGELTSTVEHGKTCRRECVPCRASSDRRSRCATGPI
ncbi:MAG: RNA polymerase sigma factor [Solirubrobacteraceae bacterium]